MTTTQPTPAFEIHFAYATNCKDDIASEPCADRASAWQRVKELLVPRVFGMGRTIHPTLLQVHQPQADGSTKVCEFGYKQPGKPLAGHENWYVRSYTLTGESFG